MITRDRAEKHGQTCEKFRGNLDCFIFMDTGIYMINGVGESSSHPIELCMFCGAKYDEF
jgi:hypothetical protein